MFNQNYLKFSIKITSTYFLSYFLFIFYQLHKIGIPANFAGQVYDLWSPRESMMTRKIDNCYLMKIIIGQWRKCNTNLTLYRCWFCVRAISACLGVTSPFSFSRINRDFWRRFRDIVGKRKKRKVIDARIAGKTLAFQAIALVRCTSAWIPPDTRPSNTREQRTRTRVSRAASTIRRDHQAVRQTLRWRGTFRIFHAFSITRIARVSHLHINFASIYVFLSMALMINAG
jgi:hypothetical protein